MAKPAFAWPAIPEGDPPERRIGQSDPWQPGFMVTQERAARVAAELYPDDVTDGGDCRAEVGREGMPCGVCDARNLMWSERVRAVRLAMLKAFT